MGELWTASRAANCLCRQRDATIAIMSERFAGRLPATLACGEQTADQQPIKRSVVSLNPSTSADTTRACGSATSTPTWPRRYSSSAGSANYRSATALPRQLAYLVKSVGTLLVIVEPEPDRVRFDAPTGIELACRTALITLPRPELARVLRFRTSVTKRATTDTPADDSIGSDGQCDSRRYLSLLRDNCHHRGFTF